MARTGSRLLLELVFTITTDLGDSFLFPDEFIDLIVTAQVATPSGNISIPLAGQGKLQWRPGMRVAKPTFDISGNLQKAIASGAKFSICVGTKAKLSADGIHDILTASGGGGDINGQVMPAWVRFDEAGDDVEVSTRRIYLEETGDARAYVEFEEEIGESIARHVWDAGVLAFCAIAGTSRGLALDSTRHGCMDAMRRVFTETASPNVLELGCGVGILGVGLSAIYPQLQSQTPGRCTVLMTDLEEAEGRARSNIARLSSSTDANVQLLYENLDWEDGRQGKFGTQVRNHRWDLIMLSDCTYNVDMLPALVETLSELHTSNMTQEFPADTRRSTKVFLATKPRHVSERALFALMSHQGWIMHERQILPLPVIGSEAESVELYMFEKE